MTATPPAGDTGSTPPQGLDPAIQDAQSQSAAPARPAEQATIDALHKERDPLLLSDPGSPQHALYQQALKGLEVLGGDRFKDRKELERIALMVAMQASALGLARVDRVALSEDGAGYFFVDELAVDPAMRGYISHAQALQPGAPQRLAGQVQAVEQQRAAESQQRNEQVQRDVQQREQLEQRRRQDPPQRLL